MVLQLSMQPYESVKMPVSAFSSYTLAEFDSL